MRIAYVAQTEADRESGVNKKIIDQVREWARIGHDPGLFVLSRTAGRWPGWDAVAPRVYSYRGHLHGLRAAARLVDDLRRWAPDAVYFRMGVCYPAFQRLARGGRVVVELNTDDDREARLRMGPLKYIVFRHGARRLLERAAGAVSATTSVAERLRARGLEVLALGNGIDLSRHAPSPAPRNATPRLLFLGSAGCAWHGVDKVALLARRFPEWRIDVVGLSRDDVEGDWTDNVVFHGFLPFDRYRKLFDEVDVALGTLALHRNGMTDASSLKVREYLAAGIPVILGHRDVDLAAPPFVLQLPNEDSNVTASLDRIEAFVGRWKGRRVERSEVAHLDVRHKESRRLTFVERVVAGAGRRG
jgi:glycosyltransferase involved in cell wall biosynthesis